MTDIALNDAALRVQRARERLSDTSRVRRRYRAEFRFRAYGLMALGIAFTFLVILFSTIISQGWQSFLQTQYKLDVTFDPEIVDPSGKRDRNELLQADYTELARRALQKAVGAENLDRPGRRDLNNLLSRGVDVQLRDVVLADPSVIGQTRSVFVLAHGNIDALLKGTIDRNVPQERRQVNDRQLGWVDKLVAEGRAQKRFNSGLFTFAASSQPETAGLAAALAGSFFMMLIVAGLSVPLGVRRRCISRNSRRRAGSPIWSR